MTTNKQSSLFGLALISAPLALAVAGCASSGPAATAPAWKALNAGTDVLCGGIVPASVIPHLPGCDPATAQ